MSKITRSICLYIVLFASGFFVATIICQGRINSLENGLADVEAINIKLQDENQRATEHTRIIERELADLTGRINLAQGITGAIAASLEGDGNTIDRAIERVNRIEKALQIIFDGMQD
jgi:hypothetical protein